MTLKRNTTRSFWLSWLLLPLLFVAGDRIAGYFLRNTIEGARFRYARLYGSEGAPELLLLGNSRGLTFFQPYISEKTGQKNLNLSYNGLPMDVGNALAQDALDRYPDTKILLIDITMCDRENDELLSGFLSYSRNSPRLQALLKRKLPKAFWGAEFSDLYRYNNEIAQRAMFHRRESDEAWLLDRQIAPALADKLAEQAGYPLELHPYLINQLAETVAYARSKGVKVVLLISPYFPGFAEKVANLDALKTAVEQATGLPVHDYRNALASREAFGDFQHPNIRGSKQYVDLLIKDGLFSP